jgi:endoglucanase
VRLPFLWERLQPELDADLDPGHWRLIQTLVEAARQRDMHVVLDLHQYGRRQLRGRPEIIGESAAVRSEHFAAFWTAVAARVKHLDHVILGLMNEPHDQDTSQLVRLQNLTIEAVRAAGSSNLVLVSGNAWSGAHSWVSSGNASAMLEIADSAHSFAFDVHQYLDPDSSGRAATCVGGSGGRLAPFTNWAREHGKRGFLGEFGAGSTPSCATELHALLEHVAANRDVWTGWTYWAGGAWWDDDYPLNIQPASLSNPVDRPQMSVLRRFFE